MQAKMNMAASPETCRWLTSNAVMSLTNIASAICLLSLSTAANLVSPSNLCTTMAMRSNEEPPDLQGRFATAL
jgi:hypothetical protein